MRKTIDRLVVRRQSTGKKAVLAVSLVGALLIGTPGESAAMQDPVVAVETPVITITKTVVGDPSAEPFQIVISPEVAGCTAEQTLTIDGAGGTAIGEVIAHVAGPISFTAADFVVTPVFGDVRDFDFAIDMTGITARGNYVNAPFTQIDYTVFGSLTGTPSGFPAFNLVRSISFVDFVNQQSSFAFTTNDDADLSNGLQVSELFGPDLVLVLNAREVGTGRYHPPRLMLRADGTGRIENSNNQGGINPATMQEVDVDFGEEYISDLSFDPETLTLAPGTACTYTVTEQPGAGFEPDVASFAGVAAGETVAIVNTAVPVLCQGKAVTIDMRTNGGNGVGTPGDDVIQGTIGADTIFAGAGDDTVCAGGGADVVYAGPGEDQVFGQLGDDKLFGRQGNDHMDGGDGADTLHGNLGDDVLIGGLGPDRIFGYAGADTIDGGEGDDRLHGNFGNDVMSGGPGDDTMAGYGDDDHLMGGDGDDTLRGNFGDDRLDAGSGNDIVWGSDGDDELNGGPGDDELNGNSLNDTLNGGQGNDVLDGGIDTDICNGNSGVDTASRCETVTGIP